MQPTVPKYCQISGCCGSISAKRVAARTQLVCDVAKHHRGFLVRQTGCDDLEWEFSSRGKGGLKGIHVDDIAINSTSKDKGPKPIDGKPKVQQVETKALVDPWFCLFLFPVF